MVRVTYGRSAWYVPLLLVMRLMKFGWWIMQKIDVDVVGGEWWRREVEVQEI